VAAAEEERALVAAGTEMIEMGRAKGASQAAAAVLGRRPVGEEDPWRGQNQSKPGGSSSPRPTRPGGSNHAVAGAGGSAGAGAAIEAESAAAGGGAAPGDVPDPDPFSQLTSSSDDEETNG
jgi:hypothetical protein